MSRGWSQGSSTRWRVFRAYILKRDNYLCRIGSQGCTGVAPLTGGHVDHITPLHMGGEKYDPANARASCQHCNLTRKKAQAYEEPPFKRVSSW